MKSPAVILSLGAALLSPGVVAQAFNHPGIFLDQSGLNLMATRVANKQNPWYDAYNAMKNDQYATRTQPTPFATVSCGPTSTPDVGCSEEKSDSLVAYSNALQWVITKDQSKADRAITFLNAWGKTLKAHKLANAPLQAAWTAANWVRAAEIIRHTGAGWSDADVATFSNMLKNAYLPLIKGGSTYYNNWEMTMKESTIGIAVFTDDRDLYNDQLNKFFTSTAQYFYLDSDGDLPVHPPGYSDQQVIDLWYGLRSFVNGTAQEICRDLAHSSYGIASVSHVFETVKAQGRNLYKEPIGQRLRWALGFQSQYDPKGGNASPPNSLCGGSLDRAMDAVTEPGFAALGTVYDMPNTKKFTLNRRPASSNNLFVAFETLTHAGS